MATMYLLLVLTSSILWLSCNADPDSGLFIFGDSLVDVGTNSYIPVTLAHAIESPYGIDYPGGKATGRFGNGKIYPDFVVKPMMGWATLSVGYTRQKC